jgi:hypothetical protein
MVKIDKESQLGIKFFSEKAHKDMFDSGQFFSNAISYYRKNEKVLGDGRGDDNERILEYRPTKNNQATLETLKGQKFSGKLISVKQELLENQHIFSFTLLEREWYKVKGDEFSIKIQKEISSYFSKNYGQYYSVFAVDVLVEALKNKLLDNGCLGYISHFKVEYVDETTLTSRERFAELTSLVDRIIELEDDFETGYPLFIDFYKKYMGFKSVFYSKEHEIRIILGDDSAKSSIIQLNNFKAV